MQMAVGLSGHDQLLKQLLQAFFADFPRLFDPETADKLDLGTVTFVNPETFTDIPQGERRTADLVARVGTLMGDPELVLIHAEAQRKREPNFPQRMWEYYHLLRLRERLPVIPIALVLYPGRAGITLEEYSEGVFGRAYVTFRYLQISLPRLPADDYLTKGPLAAGLASLMRPAAKGRAARIALHLACLRGVQQAAEAGELDDARMELLVNMIATYLPLSATERNELRVQLQRGGDTTMEATELTWADRILLRGRTQGRQEGVAEGCQEGLRVARHAVLALLTKQVGPLPPSVGAGLDRIDARGGWRRSSPWRSPRVPWRSSRTPWMAVRPSPGYVTAVTGGSETMVYGVLVSTVQPPALLRRS